MTKTCKRCSMSKPRSEFYRCRTMSDGLRAECKPCHQALGREWRESNRVRYQQKNREWYEQNKEYRAVTVDAWQKKNADSYYKRNQERAWKKAGIELTVEERAAMLEQQEGKCAVCGTEESSLKRRLAVDHDHKTGIIRGLLCDTCNYRVVSVVENTPHLLDAAKQYLSKSVIKVEAC